MHIDKALNLVIPVDTESGTVYVHSMPIGREVFERYFLPISKTFAAIYSEGLDVLAGPKVAALMLRRIAEKLGEWEGEGGVGNGLMNEIRRLTNVVGPTASGWKATPFQDVVDKGLMDADDLLEVEGHLVFFICISAMHKRSQVPAMMAGACELWALQTTSQNCTEYAASLPTLTETANSGETATLSSIPS